jgi:DNA-binding YbaB/EbfC family protein
MLDKMKQMYELQKKAKEMQKAVEAMTVERVSAGGKVSLVMNGNFKVERLSIDESALIPGNKAALEKTLAELFTGAAEEVRAASTRQAMGMMKEMNIKLPGM